MNLILDIMTLVYASLCSSLFCQLPSCNLFTRMYAIIIYGETPLVNCGPRSFFLKLIKQPTAILLLSFSANKHHFPHIRLILCYSKPVNLTVKLGQSILIVLCAGSTSTTHNLFSGAVDTSGRTLVSYWFDNLGFTN